MNSGWVRMERAMMKSTFHSTEQLSSYLWEVPVGLKRKVTKLRVRDARCLQWVWHFITSTAHLCKHATGGQSIRGQSSIYLNVGWKIFYEINALYVALTLWFKKLSYKQEMIFIIHKSADYHIWSIKCQKMVKNHNSLQAKMTSSSVFCSVYYHIEQLRGWHRGTFGI